LTKYAETSFVFDDEIDDLFGNAIRLAGESVHEGSITENIDTTTSGGKLVFHIFGALAEFERDIIKDRTKAGLHAARVRGRLGGRPKAKTLDTPKKVALAQSLLDAATGQPEPILKERLAITA